MEHSNEQNNREQPPTFLKEQATYWKAFMHDLLVGTLKRLIVSPVVFGIAFLSVAFVIYRLSIQPQTVFVVLKWLEALLVFLAYGLLGGVTGFLYGANSTLLKKAEELEHGVHLIIDPLMKTIIEAIPGGQRGISIDEFNILLDSQIAKYRSTSRTQFRLLSLIGMVFRFFLRITLRILRYLLLHDFLEELEAHGESRITANAVEVYYRKKLVTRVIESVTGQLELIQYTIYALLALFLLVPLVLIVVF